MWTEACACESSNPTHICNLLSQLSQLLFSLILLQEKVPVLWRTPRLLKGPGEAASWSFLALQFAHQPLVRRMLLLLLHFSFKKNKQTKNYPTTSASKWETAQASVRTLGALSLILWLTRLEQHRVSQSPQIWNMPPADVLWQQLAGSVIGQNREASESMRDRKWLNKLLSSTAPPSHWLLLFSIKLYNVQIIQWQLNAPVLSLCGCFLGLTVYWIFLNVIWTTFLHGASLTVSAKLSVKRSSRCHYGLLCAGEQVEYSPFSPAALHGSLLLSEAGHLSGPGQRKEIFNRTNAGRKKKG